MSRRASRGRPPRGYRGGGSHGGIRHIASAPSFSPDLEDVHPPNALLPTPHSRYITGRANYIPHRSSSFDKPGDKRNKNNFNQRPPPFYPPPLWMPPDGQYHNPPPSSGSAFPPVNDWPLHPGHRPPYLQGPHGPPPPLPPTPPPISTFANQGPKLKSQQLQLQPPGDPFRAPSPNVPQSYRSQQLEGGPGISDHHFLAAEASLGRPLENRPQKPMEPAIGTSNIPVDVRIKLQEKLEVQQKNVSEQTRKLTQQSKQRGRAGEHRRREHVRGGDRQGHIGGDRQGHISRSRTCSDASSVSPNPGMSNPRGRRGNARVNTTHQDRRQHISRHDSHHQFGAIGESSAPGQGGSVPDVRQSASQFTFNHLGKLHTSFSDTNINGQGLNSKDEIVLEEAKVDSFFPGLNTAEGCLLEQSESESTSHFQNNRKEIPNLGPVQDNQSLQWVQSQQNHSSIPRSNSSLAMTSPHPWNHMKDPQLAQSQREFWWRVPNPHMPNSWPRGMAQIDEDFGDGPVGVTAFNIEYQIPTTPESEKGAKFQICYSSDDSDKELDEGTNEDSLPVTTQPGDGLLSSNYGEKHELNRIRKLMEAIEKFKQSVIVEMSFCNKRKYSEEEISEESVKQDEESKAMLVNQLNQLYQDLNIPVQTSFTQACETLIDFKKQVQMVREALNDRASNENYVVSNKSINQNLCTLQGLCLDLRKFNNIQDDILLKADTTLKAINKELEDSGVSLDQIQKLDDSQMEIKNLLKESVGSGYRSLSLPHIFPLDNDVFQEVFPDKRKHIMAESVSEEGMMTVAKQLTKLTLENDEEMQIEQSTPRHSSSGFSRRASCPSLQTTQYPRMFLPPSIAYVNVHVSNALRKDRLKSVDREEFVKKSTKCSLCKKTYSFPHFLHCNHVFCFSCIARLVKKSTKKNGKYRVKCPNCGTNSKLDQPDPNLLLINLPKCLYMCRMKISPFNCTWCSNHDDAVAYCSTCFNYLCPLCVDAHADNKSLSFHSVTDQLKICCFEGEIFNTCSHHGEIIRQFCETCRLSLCDTCVDNGHSDHQVYKDNEWNCVQWIDNVKSSLSRESSNLKANAEEMRGIMQKTKIMKQNIENAHRIYLRKVDDFCNAVEEMRIEASLHVDRILIKIQTNAHDYVNAIEKELTFKERKLIAFIDYLKKLKNSSSMGFVLQSLPKLYACYVDLMQFSEALLKFKNACLTISFCPSYPEVNEFFQEIFNGIDIKTNVDIDFKKNSSLKERLEDIDHSKAQSSLQLPVTLDQRKPQELSTIESWSGGSNEMTNNNPELFDYPRVTFTYKDLFGKYGRGKYEFVEPSGIQYLQDGGLAVCDTKNHRIVIFDERFQFVQFIGQPNNIPPLVDAGEISDRHQDLFDRTPGKLYFPYRIAQCPRTTNLVVVERQPSLCIQIFSLTGEFIRSFGHDTLRSPRGICVDDQGVVIVVEGRTMKVVRFSQQGKKLFYAHASLYLEFPNDIAAKDGLIYISDNRAHCVHVFDYSMEKISTIGNESVTYYPIGVTLNSLGQVIVTDNHNTFNVSVFDKDGRYLYGFRSRAKYANCFNVTVHGSKLHLAVTTRDSQVLCFDYDRRPDQPTPAVVEDLSEPLQSHDVRDV